MNKASMKTIKLKYFKIKLFKGQYRELTLFIGKLQLRFSRPQTAAWWGNKQLYSFGSGHHD